MRLICRVGMGMPLSRCWRDSSSSGFALKALAGKVGSTRWGGWVMVHVTEYADCGELDVGNQDWRIARVASMSVGNCYRQRPSIESRSQINAWQLIAPSAAGTSAMLGWSSSSSPLRKVVALLGRASIQGTRAPTSGVSTLVWPQMSRMAR